MCRFFSSNKHNFAAGVEIKIFISCGQEAGTPGWVLRQLDGDKDHIDVDEDHIDDDEDYIDDDEDHIDGDEDHIDGDEDHIDGTIHVSNNIRITCSNSSSAVHYEDKSKF